MVFTNFLLAAIGFSTGLKVEVRHLRENRVQTSRSNNPVLRFKFEPAVFGRNEIEPLQARFRVLNDWLGEKVALSLPHVFD